MVVAIFRENWPRCGQTRGQTDPDRPFLRHKQQGPGFLLLEPLTLFSRLQGSSDRIMTGHLTEPDHAGSVLFFINPNISSAHRSTTSFPRMREFIFIDRHWPKPSQAQENQHHSRGNGNSSSDNWWSRSQNTSFPRMQESMQRIRNGEWKMTSFPKRREFIPPIRRRNPWPVPPGIK